MFAESDKNTFTRVGVKHVQLPLLQFLLQDLYQCIKKYIMVHLVEICLKNLNKNKYIFFSTLNKFDIYTQGETCYK